MVNYDRKPLDPSLYYIDPRLAKLFKRSTGIQDDAQLIAHILKFQKEAYDVTSPPPHPYQFFKVLITFSIGFPIPMHPSLLVYKVHAHFITSSLDAHLFHSYRLGVTECPLYNEVIRQGRRRPEALLLEIGVGC